MAQPILLLTSWRVLWYLLPRRSECTTVRRRLQHLALRRALTQYKVEVAWCSLDSHFHEGAIRSRIGTLLVLASPAAA
jgi:hypothetical protein